MSKKILFALISVLLLTFFTGCGGSKSVDINQYVLLTYSGADGEGRVEDDFDISRFVDENADKVKYNKYAAEDYGMLSPIFEELDGRDIAELIAMEYINFTEDPSDGLSNGDTVKVVWNCPDEMIEKVFGIMLKHDDFTDTVKNLGSSGDNASSDGNTNDTDSAESTEEVDPFKAMEIIFSGVDGEGKAEVGSSQYAEVKYQISPESGLSNGDTVKVSVESNDPFFSEHNMKPSLTEREFIVEGLSSNCLTKDYIEDTGKEQIFKDASKQALSNYKSDDFGTLHFYTKKFQYVSENNGNWKLDHECDEDEVKLKALYVATNKDSSSSNKNLIYAVIEFPYKLTVNDLVISTKDPMLGKVIGEGLILYEVKYENVEQTSDGIVFNKPKSIEVVGSVEDVESHFNEADKNYDVVISEDYSDGSSVGNNETSGSDLFQKGEFVIGGMCYGNSKPDEDIPPLELKIKGDKITISGTYKYLKGQDGNTLDGKKSEGPVELTLSSDIICGHYEEGEFVNSTKDEFFNYLNHGSLYLELYVKDGKVYKAIDSV